MEPGAILLILTVLILTAVFISRPFFEPAPKVEKTSAEDHQRSALLAEQDRILTVLQELEFDHALGKIPEDEYPAQRAYLMQLGAGTLRQLDALQPAKKAAPAEDRLEAAIAARRADGRSSGTIAMEDDDLEKIISARRQAQKENSNGFCPACGKPVLKSDRFCPRCGARLEESQ